MSTPAVAQVLDLGTRIQRRRDFAAHLLGFGLGAGGLTVLHLTSASAGPTLVGAVLAWATALSFQHFGHVLRGPVTLADVGAEANRLAPTQH
jgi:hypothetical protein